MFAFFYVVATMFFIAPKFAVKFFSFFGFEKAEETCYVRIYEKSNSNSDLYNLILFENKLQNDEKELYYLNILMNDENYQNFYEKLDDSALREIEDKSMIAYTCNTNSYLINQKIKCMYNLGFDRATSLTVSNYIKSVLENENLFDSAFLTYVELVKYDSNLSLDEKQQRIDKILGVVNLLLTDKLTNIQTYLEGEDLELSDEIIAQHSIVNIKKAYYLIDLIYENEDVASSKLEYQKELSKYILMVK